MRSTFNGLSTMVRGIMANQLSLDTTGHNIVNAGTEGYSRQSVNLVATRCQMVGTARGDAALGTGVDAMSITRARSVYADRQYRAEVAIQERYDVLQMNYDKLETIFNDSDGTGIQNAMTLFWKSLESLSANSSDPDYRRNVISQAGNLVNMIQLAASELQDQIADEYNEISMRVEEVNHITEEIVNLNKQITAMEVTGATANDLRDQRDLLVDDLSKFMDITTSENAEGRYAVITNGVTLVSGVSRLTLEYSRSISSAIDDVNYGVSDHSIEIAETKIILRPLSGSLRGNFDAIDECKSYIDKLANISTLMLTTFNEQHKAGYDLNGDRGDNFFGEAGYTYGEVRIDDSTTDYPYVTKDGEKITGIDIINELRVGLTFNQANLIAANSSTGKTGQGNNAVLLANYFNMPQSYTESNSNVNNLYYYYKNATNNTSLDYYTDYLTTITDEDADGNEETFYRETVYSNNDSTVGVTGTVYKYTKKEDGSVFYKDAKGNKLEINSDGSFSNEDGDLTYEFNSDSDGFIVYEDSSGNFIYKKYNDDSSPTYTYYERIPGTTDSEPYYNKYEVIRQPSTTPSIDDFDEGSTIRYTSTTGTTIYAEVERGDPIRSIGEVSIWDYYNEAMTKLGIDAETMDIKVEIQDDVMTQVENWRASEMGVDWNEELTNMIRFQKGFAACARCLTAMDEMLDRLVNSTGMVGR